jgi:hypothetical protein
MNDDSANIATMLTMSARLGQLKIADATVQTTGFDLDERNMV